MTCEKHSISRYMTNTPKSIDAKATLEDVRSTMRDLDIRHLPVEHDGKLVGVVSKSNVSAASLCDGHTALLAEDIMIPSPLVVPPDTTLEKVTASMAKDKLDCALIREENGPVLGIFTTTDACLAIQSILTDCHGHSHSKKHGHKHGDETGDHHDIA